MSIEEAALTGEAFEGRVIFRRVCAAHLGDAGDGRVLSETDFFDDLTSLDVPVLVMHGEDDQICPSGGTGAKAIKLLKHGTLKTYPGYPHGMPTTHADVINADLLAFIQT